MLKKSLSIFIIPFILSMFSACSQFLEGSNVKKELTGFIEYQNARKTTVKNITDTSDFGDISPAEIVLTEGESYEVTFIKKTDIRFDKWLCIETSSGALIDYEAEDSPVKISEITTEDGINGRLIIKSTVTLKKSVSALTVKPHCFFSNELTSPVFKNLILSRSEEEDENNFISCYGTDFENETEDNFFEDYASGTDQDAITAAIKKHHAGKDIWISYDCRDEDSGLDYLTLEARLIKTTKCVDVVNSPVYSRNIFNTFSQTEENPGISHPETVKTGKIKYTLPEDADGVIRLNFSLCDKNGNTFVFTVDLIKDTVIEPGVTNSSLIDLQEEDKITDTAKTVAQARLESGRDDGMLIFPYYFVFYPSLNPYIIDMNGKSYFDSAEWSVSSVETWTESNPVPKNYDFNWEKLNSYKPENREETFYNVLKTESINFEKDPYEDMYLKVTLKDGAGNIYEHFCNLYKSLEIQQLIHDAANNQLLLLLNGKIAENASPYALSSGDENEGFEKISSNEAVNKKISSITVKKIKVNGNQFNINSLPAGKYYISVKGAGKAYSSSPYCFYVNTTEPEYDTPSETDIPSFTVSADDAVPNSAKRTVHIKFPDNFTENRNFSYIIQYSHETTALFPALLNYTNLKDFEVDNHLTEYKFKVFVYNKTGSFVSSEAKTLDLNEDNIPPEISFNTAYAPEKLILENLTVTDKGSGFETVDSKISIKYAFSNTVYDTDNYEIDWEDGPLGFNWIDWEPGTPLTFFRNGTNQKCLYLQIQDKKGNYTEQPLGFNEYYKEEIPCNLEGSDLIPDMDFSSFNNLVIKVQYLENNEWKFISGGFDQYSGKAALTDEEKKSFIRFYFYDFNYTSGYTYLCPASYLPSFKADAADLLKGTRGYTVLTDQPFIIYTLYCDFNLGDELSDWQNLGIEAKIHYGESNYTYVEENIPYAAWYINVVRFADGTIIKTEPAQYD